MSEAPPPAPAISLVIPLYNEEGNVRPAAKGLLGAFDGSQIAYELILVVNGSLDRTPQECEEVAREHPRVRLVRVPVNRGFGHGILAGLAEAKGAWIGFAAGDGQLAPEDAVAVARAAIEGRHDLVKAVRKGRSDRPLRKFVTRVYNATIRAFFRVESPDTHGIPKFLRRSDLAWLQLSSRDWFLDDEILIKYRAEGRTVLEVPATWRERGAGRSHVRIGTVVEFLGNLAAWKLWRMRRWRKAIRAPRS